MTLLDTIKSVLGLDDGRSDDRRGERSEATAPATDSEDAVKGTDDDEPAATGGDAAGSTESMLDESAEGGAEQGEITGPAAGDDASADLDADDDTQADESAAAGGDAAGSTGSMTDESSSEGAAEPGEAVGPTDEEDFAPDHDEDDTASEASDDVAGGDGTAADAAAAGGDAAGSTGSVTEETNESISAAEDAEATGPTDADPTEDTADHGVDALKGIGPSYAERLEAAGIGTVDDLADADPAELAEEIDVAESRVERWSERAKARRQ